MSTDPRQAGHVDADVRDGVATVEFGHPRSNSLPGALLGRLANEITRVGAMADVHVIVLRSSGTGAFCAGASFDEMQAIADADAGLEFFSGFARVILAMVRAPQVVVARVHGKVTGGGVGLIAASDYALATRDAAFKLSELAVGIGPFVIGPVVERRVGPGPFAALSLDADWRDAAWAERHGLYARVLEDVPSLDAELARRVAFMRSANPEALRQLKQVFWRGTEHWETLLAERAGMSGRMVLSDFTRSAIAAFAKPKR